MAERLLWEQEAAGSNPVAPMTNGSVRRAGPLAILDALLNQRLRLRPKGADAPLVHAEALSEHSESKDEGEFQVEVRLLRRLQPSNWGWLD